MAQIDALLSHMIASGTTRALLRGDVPSQLETNSGVSEGNIVSNTTLEDIFLEIAPDQACQDISSSCVADFEYNGFSFHVTINPESEVLTFNISPIVAANTFSPSISADSEPETTPEVQEGTSAIPSAYDIPEQELISHPPEVAQPTEVDNDSGQGVDSLLPPELRGFNWGAFFLPLFWSIAHNTWIGLLSLVPCVGIFMQLALGFKGNEWAWKNRKFNSLVQFRNVQRAWTLAGVGIFAVGVCVSAAIILPAVRDVRESAERMNCTNNLRLISVGIIRYVQAHSGHFPIGSSSERLKQELQPYLPMAESFECPADETKGNDDYVFNKHISGQSVIIVKDPTNTPLVWEKNSNAHLGGRNIAFADGHVQWYKESDAQAWIAPYK